MFEFTYSSTYWQSCFIDWNPGLLTSTIAPNSWHSFSSLHCGCLNDVKNYCCWSLTGSQSKLPSKLIQCTCPFNATLSAMIALTSWRPSWWLCRSSSICLNQIRSVWVRTAAPSSHMFVCTKQVSVWVIFLWETCPNVFATISSGWFLKLQVDRCNTIGWSRIRFCHRGTQWGSGAGIAFGRPWAFGCRCCWMWSRFHICIEGSAVLLCRRGTSWSWWRSTTSGMQTQPLPDQACYGFW